MKTEEENTTTPSPEADGKQEESKPSLTIEIGKYTVQHAVEQAITQEVAGLTITN